MEVHVVLQGTDEMGYFVTSPFKQYPTGFNQSIAFSAVACWDRLGFLAAVDEDAYEHSASSFFVPLDPFCEQQTLGAYGSDLAVRDAGTKTLRAAPLKLTKFLSSMPTSTCCPCEVT